MSELTADNLKNALWETLTEVKSGVIPIEQGNSIAGLARETLKAVKIQMEGAHQAKKPLSEKVVKFITE